MLMYDIIFAFGLLLALYFEFEYLEGRSAQEKSERDPIRRFYNFSVRIKSITIILVSIFYFIIRLINVW